MKKKRQGFTVREVHLHQHGYAYKSYQVEGWTGAGRYRKRFKSKADAYGHKTELEVMAANHGEIVARNTRLSREQLAQVESAFARLGAQSLPAALPELKALASHRFKTKIIGCLFVHKQVPAVIFPVPT